MTENTSNFSTLRILAIAAGTLLATTVFYVGGQGLAFINLPLGLVLTSLFVFGAGGLVLPPLFNLRAPPLVGLRMPAKEDLLFALLVGLANFGPATAMMAVSEQIFPESMIETARAMTRLMAGADIPTRWMLTVAAGIAAPIGEELFFRGWLQSMLGLRYGRWTSALLAAALFSAIHFDAVGFAARWELGLVFGLARAWTGSVLPGIVMHATHNLGSIAILYLSDDPLKQIDQPPDWLEVGPFSAVSLIVAVALLVIWRRRTAATERAPEAVRIVEADPPLALNLAGIKPFGVAAAAFVVAAIVIALVGKQLPGAGMVRMPDFGGKSAASPGR